MYKIDTETIGLTGPVVLIQYRIEKDPIQLYHLWDHPIKETLQLIEYLIGGHVGMYNMTFDSFHLAKMYNTLRLCSDHSAPPDPVEFEQLEKHAWNGVCLKPPKCSDFLLLLKENGFQFLNKRKPIRVKRVPRIVAEELRAHLEKLPLNPLLFARSGTGHRWKIHPIPKDENFVDLKLKFTPSIAMKKVCSWLFNREIIEFPIDKRFMPDDSETQWRPHSSGWRPFLEYHRGYWKNQGGPYAIQDIELLDILEGWLEGRVEGKIPPQRVLRLEDELHLNSELAWMVGVNRQRGYPVDLLETAKYAGRIISNRAAVPTGARPALKFLLSEATPGEKLLIKKTDKKTLEAVIEMGGPIAEKAKKIKEQRRSEKLLDILNKLLEGGRWHPDFRIIGTFSNRMAGSGNFNAQGIPRDLEFRKLFTLKDEGEYLTGGDFESQEPSILDAEINDPWLHSRLRLKESVHSVFGEILHKRPITKAEKEVYTKCKSGFLAYIYGAMAERVAEVTGVPLPEVQRAFMWIVEHAPGLHNFRTKIYNDFCSMRQPAGLGTKVEWYEPKNYVESMFQYRRYFDIENLICKYFFVLSEAQIIKNSTKIVRRDREQSVTGATQSALFAAAFNLQAANLRQAGNHKIQNAGAEVTKRLQYNIWTIQPVGIHPWMVRPFNVHDEVICPTTVPHLVKEKVDETILSLRERIPLLGIDWKSDMANWSEK